MAFTAKPTFYSSLLLALLLGGSLAAQGARADLVYLDKNGKQRELGGEVTSHTYRGLVMKRRGGDKTVTEEELVSLSYAREPEGYSDAVTLFEAGDYYGSYDRCLEVLEALDKKKHRYDWAVQELLYRASTAAYRTQQLADAKKLAADLLKRVPETRYKPALELRQAEEAYALGNFDKAAAAFGSVSDEGVKRGYAATYVLKGALGKVRALIGAGKSGPAASALKVAEGMAKSAEAKDRVALASADLLLANKSLAEATSRYTALLQKANAKQLHKSRPFLLAGAANGLGDIAFQQEKFEEATFQYSKTFALYAEAEGLEDQVGWSLWKFCQASKRIANATNDEEKKRAYTIRHRRMRDRAANEFRLTRGGQLARKELGLSQ